jgi:hypothetical protein
LFVFFNLFKCIVVCLKRKKTIYFSIFSFIFFFWILKKFPFQILKIHKENGKQKGITQFIFCPRKQEIVPKMKKEKKRKNTVQLQSQSK